MVIRPSGNPISAKNLVRMFDNKDLAAESSELIKTHRIEIFGNVAHAVFTLNEIFLDAKIKKNYLYEYLGIN